MKKKRESAAEIVARLDRDPGRRARCAVRDAELLLIAERRRKEVIPLADDLRAAGLDLASPWELSQRPADLELAFPVLLQHLRMPHSENTLGNIASLFQRREARPYWESLLSLYGDTTDNSNANWRFQLAHAIVVMASKSDLDTLLELLRDRRLGTSRIAFVPAVIKLGKERGWEALTSLKDDPDLSKEIAHRFSGKERRERAKENRAPASGSE